MEKQEMVYGKYVPYGNYRKHIHHYEYDSPKCRSCGRLRSEIEKETAKC